ncbi:MAG: DUF4179 domain-containing protein [Lachnospiraceae bacterium]|nr:DUF4179 domain-containing protein [Lachnospiraceae bacterium]
MDRERYEFLECLGHVDERFIEGAGQPWEKKRKKGGYLGVRAACAALVALLGLGTVFHQQVEAAVAQLGTQIAQWLFIEKDLATYTEVIEEAQVVNGVSMTLKEVILDSNKIMAVVETEKAEGEQTPANVFLNEVKINGEWLESFAGSTSDMNPLYGENTKTQGYYLEYMIDEHAMPDKISSVELQLQYAEPGEEKGTWESKAEFCFQFSATKEELSQKKYEIPLNCDIDAGNGLVFHFQEITCTDVTSRIRAVCDGEPRSFEEFNGETVESFDYMLDVETDEGEHLSYMAVDYDEATKEMTFDSMDGNPPKEEAVSLEISLKRLRPMEEEIFLEDLMEQGDEMGMKLTDEDLPEELGAVRVYPQEK